MEYNISINKNVLLGRTSLWLLYPLYINFLKNWNNTNNTWNIWNIWNNTNSLIYIFTWLWIFTTSIISYTMWEIYDKKSLLLYNLDIIFARGTFALLSYLTLIVRKPTVKMVTLPVGVGTFFLLTNKFYEYEYYVYSIFSHLMFRYIGFWWTYIIFNNSIPKTTFIVISSTYLIHIFHLSN